jgi:hypothetical protein
MLWSACTSPLLFALRAFAVRRFGAGVGGGFGADRGATAFTGTRFVDAAFDLVFGADAASVDAAAVASAATADAASAEVDSLAPSVVRTGDFRAIVKPRSRSGAAILPHG